jgi:hypothetical protein
MNMNMTDSLLVPKSKEKTSKRKRQERVSVGSNNTTRKRILRKWGRSIKALHLQAPHLSYNELCKISDDVMMQLQVVRDNGRWDLFDDVVVTLSHKYPSDEAQVVIYLEKGMAACYNNRLEDAKDIMTAAIDMASGTQNSSLLIGKASFE